MLYLSMIEDEADHATFEQIYYTMKDEMLRIANELLKNHADAEDAVQEAFIGLAISIKYVPKEPTPMRAYCLTAARNAAIRYYKKNTHWREFLHIDSVKVSADNDVFDHIAKIEDQQFFENILIQIPLNIKEVLMLRYVSDMPPRRIANLLHRKPATIRKQLQRGKQMLVACYTEAVAHE